jgi:hypothetical protein
MLPRTPRLEMLVAERGEGRCSALHEATQAITIAKVAKSSTKIKSAISLRAA